MIIKKLIFILIFFAITNCGYNPIYTSKNIKNLAIKDIQLEGDKNVNRKILSFLNLKKNSNNDLGYILELSSKKVVETVAKDKLGNASIYKLTIKIDFLLKDETQIIKEKIFVSSFSYNNNENKFDLFQFKKAIELNLIEKIAEKITIFLNS